MANSAVSHSATQPEPRPYADSGVLQGLELVGEQPERVRLDWRGAPGRSFPAWLNGGALLRNGPSLYRVGQDTFRHLFDGLTMLRGFYFDASGVSFAARYLQSPDFRDSTARQRICYTEFGTAPDRTLLERIAVEFQPARQFGDNCNVNIIPNGADWWAVYDWPVPMAVDPRTLATRETVEFTDGATFVLATPHPLFDFARSEWINFGIRVRAALQPLGYSVYRQKLGTAAREEIAFIPRLDPAYMHSFALTEHFVVLVEHPFTPKLNLLVDAFMDRPLVDGFGWHGDRPTRFVVIDRTLNRLVCEIEVDPVLVLHVANAFEDRGRIVIDVSAYPDDGILRALYLEELARRNNVPAGRLYRYTLDLGALSAGCIRYPDIGFEMPRFNDAWQFKPYQALYGNSKQDLEGRDFFDSLIKINPEQGTRVLWHEPGVFPGEPVFVARPGASAEDDGVVLCVVRHPAAGQFYLLLLDGRDFTEIGRAVSPDGVGIAPDFHGNFAFLDQPGN